MEGRYQGWADIDLDELGKKQAVAVANRCREMKPAAIYSSDLRRCADVANLVGEATDVAVTFDQRLRERDVGEWSGHTRDEVHERWPDDLAAWNAGDESVRPGGGESMAQLCQRIASFIDDVRALEAEGNVVVLSHAAWIRTVPLVAFGNNFERRAVGVPSQGSLSIWRLSRDGGTTLEAYNDRGHLLDVEAVDLQAPLPPIY